MKRAAPKAISFVLALALVPFLPLYLERTMLRSFLVENAGDRIDWGWQLTSLRDYWSNYNYMAREQRPALWLTLDVFLAVLYAMIVAIIVDQILAWRRKKLTGRS